MTFHWMRFFGLLGSVAGMLGFVWIFATLTIWLQKHGIHPVWPLGGFVVLCMAIVSFI
jgi:hypothetical protein